MEKSESRIVEAGVRQLTAPTKDQRHGDDGSLMQLLHEQTGV